MARILSHVTVCRDGLHNGFTDLQHWSGCYWLTYRKGSGHVGQDGRIAMALSADRERWSEVAGIKVPGDNRDPKLICMSEECLALTIPSWLGGYEKRRLQQFITFSDNGISWDTPRPILPEGHWLWRVRRHENRYFGLVKSIPPRDGTGRLELHVSDDLCEWQFVSVIGDANHRLDESDIHWLPDGTAWVIARELGRDARSCFATASAPYREWTVKRLPQLVHAPIMLAHGDSLYVAGRCDMDIEGVATFPFLARRSMAIWRLTGTMLDPVMYIPALCDCAYPGLIHDPEGRICLSYYSQHAYHMGIAPRSYRLETREPYDNGTLLSAADIYFAELDLS